MSTSDSPPEPQPWRGGATDRPPWEQDSDATQRVRPEQTGSGALQQAQTGAEFRPGAQPQQGSSAAQQRSDQPQGTQPAEGAGPEQAGGPERSPDEVGSPSRQGSPGQAGGSNPQGVPDQAGSQVNPAAHAGTDRLRPEWTNSPGEGAERTQRVRPEQMQPPAPTTPSAQAGAQPPQAGDQSAQSGGPLTHTGGQPVQAADSPAEPGPQPTQAGGQPTQAGVQSTNVGSQPMQAGAQPTNAGSQPTQPGAQSAQAGGQPAHTGGQPAQTRGQPAHTGAQPAHTGAQPAHTGAQPPHTGGQHAQATPPPAHPAAQPPHAGSPHTGAQPAGPPQQQPWPPNRPPAPQQPPPPQPAQPPGPPQQPDQRELAGTAPRGDSALRRAARTVTRAFGGSKQPRELEEVLAAVQAPVTTGRRIAVTSVRGGAGKTATAALLGSVFAGRRTEPVLAVDADPVAGSLPWRLGTASAMTLPGLAPALRTAAGQHLTALERLLPRTSRGLWVAPGGAGAQHELVRDVTRALSRLFAVEVLDCGTGLGSELLADAHAVVVAVPATADGVRTSAEVLGRLGPLPHAVVALNHLDRQGAATLRAEAAQQAFTRLGLPVVELPYDRHVAAGTAIDPGRLAEPTITAASRLAAWALHRTRTL